MYMVRRAGDIRGVIEPYARARARLPYMWEKPSESHQSWDLARGLLNPSIETLVAV
jgi:hypothetical protein